MECFSSWMATSTWGVVEEHRNFKFCFTLHKNDKKTHDMFQIAIRENALSKAKPTSIQQIWKWLILQVKSVLEGHKQEVQTRNIGSVRHQDRY